MMITRQIANKIQEQQKAYELWSILHQIEGKIIKEAKKGKTSITVSLKASSDDLSELIKKLNQEDYIIYSQNDNGISRIRIFWKEPPFQLAMQMVMEWKREFKNERKDVASCSRKR